MLHLALSTLPTKQRRALAAAVPALAALARAIDRLADAPDPPPTRPLTRPADFTLLDRPGGRG